MKKEFNDTGLCIPQKHFMVDTTPKLNQTMDLIDRGKYFTINRPRQFGKTTTINLLYQKLLKAPGYLVIRISFEAVGDAMFADENIFSKDFLEVVRDRIKYQDKSLSKFFDKKSEEVQRLKDLGEILSDFVLEQDKKVVLMIDEVDKASSNLLFLHFIGMLRDNYFLRDIGEIHFFQSVILVGVHDIKNLKRKIRPEDVHSLNSPWNIAVDFTIDLSFSVVEIQTMLRQYMDETQTSMDISTIAERIHYYTSGYPYLVSKMCKVIDENAWGKKKSPVGDTRAWSLDDIEASFRYLVNPAYTTPLFDDLAKNLNNHEDLYDLVFEVVINGEKRNFNIDNATIGIASTYGILKANEKGFCQVYNRIFEQRIYNFILSNQEQKKKNSVIRKSLFEDEDGTLNLKDALLFFQAFMQEHYAKNNDLFLERQGRLLSMSFLKLILNGKGFDFKEPVVGDERRTDIVITYFQHQYVVELKRWQSEQYHRKGLQQLSDYLNLYQLKEGYLLIYDFRKNKVYKQKHIRFQDKNIFAVWV